MDKKRIFALGFFDGVHVGHQALLKACRELAAQTGAEAAAVTFETHPDALVLGKAPQMINTAGDRLRLLHSYGITHVQPLAFDRRTMTMPWQDFFRMLLQDWGAAGLVCGNDFRFGYRGEGTAQMLRGACADAGIPCTVVPEQTVEGVRVSSTYIRGLMEAGEMERAVKFLGHPQILTGVVMPGHRLGRTIGIPTANLALPAGILEPKRGVYACRVALEGKTYSAVTNVGCRPTVGGTYVTVEPWILDFDGDLYGREITLEFHAFLRPEQRFPSLEAMVEEIRRNAVQTREFFRKS